MIKTSFTRKKRALLLFAAILLGGCHLVSAQITITFQTQQPLCSGSSSGVITAIPSGGTAPYSYLWNNGATVNPLQSAPAGNYQVTVTDATGSTGDADIILGQPPLLNGLITVTYCGLPGAMSVTPFGGVPPYSYLWSTGATTQNIAILDPGTYQINILDANNCGFIGFQYIGTPLSASIGTTNAGCGTGVGGSATATLSGGVSPFSYNWSNGLHTQTISNLPPNSYSVTVTAANNCTATASGTVATSPGSIGVTIDVIPPSCTGTNNGVATAISATGVAPFTYAWSNGQTAATILNLSPGTYTVTLTDDFGCSGTASATLVAQAPVSLNVTSGNPSCQGATNGFLNATVSGGTAPYFYLWSNGATTPNINNLGVGTYSLTVTDALACTASASIPLTAAPGMVVNVTSGNPTCQGAANGFLNAMASGGVAPYTYLWSNGATTQTVSNVPAGTYSVTVTDNAGCPIVKTTTLTAPSAMVVSVSATNASQCGASNGSVTAVPSGGNPPYSYQWNFGGTSNIVTGISAGQYTVTVTSMEGCTATGSATVGQPNTLDVVVSGTNSVCGSAAGGALNTTVTYGTAPFSYLWNTGATSPGLTNIAAGTYSVTVTSAQGCTGSGSKTILQNPSIVPQASVTPTQCFGLNNGSINVTTSGGTLPFSYLWNTGATTSYLPNLSAGNYFLTISDAAGCTATQSIPVPQPAAIGVFFTVNPGCGNTNQVMAGVQGGSPPYTYLWNTGSVNPAIFNLAPGGYSVTVTDSHGCSASAATMVTGFSSPVLSLTPQNTTCNGTSDGMVTSTILSGNGPYTYGWSTGGTSPFISNLQPGTYSLTLTDANGCSDVESAPVQLGSSLILNFDAPEFVCPNETVQATVNPFGGTAPFVFNWSNGQTQQTATGLGVGAYSVTVTDPSGCSGMGEVSFLAGGGFVVADQIAYPSCAGSTNGSISLVVTGGLPPYFYSWNTGSTDSLIENLPSGTSYSVYVSDGSGCPSQHSFQLPDISVLNAFVSSTNAGCTGDGTASAVTEGGTPPYVFLWDNGDTTAEISDLQPGMYFLTVTDDHGCTETASAEVGQDADFFCNIQLLQTVSASGASDGALQGTAVNGTPPYSYEWSNGSLTVLAGNLSGGEHFLTVTDAENCQSVCSFHLFHPGKLGDLVWHDENMNGIQDTGEEGIAGVSIAVEGFDVYGNPVLGGTQSDFSGNYQFDLQAGSYQLTFAPTSDWLASPLDEGGNDETDSDLDPANMSIAAIMLNEGAVNASLDAGFFSANPCVNLSGAGEICCDQVLCETKVPTMFFESLAPSGGDGALEFQWYFSETPGEFDPLSWTLSPGANAETFNPANFSQDAYFVRLAKRAGCFDFLPSNVVSVQFKPAVHAEIMETEPPCFGASVQFSAADASQDAAFAWQFGNDAVPPSADTAFVDSIFWHTGGLKTIILNVSNEACFASDTLLLEVLADPNFCTENFLINATLIARDSVLIDWFYEKTDSIGRHFTVEWAWENNGFEALGEPDTAIALDLIYHYEKLHTGGKRFRNFYRVKLEDDNGAVLYSNIEEIRWTGDFNLVHVYPNPFSEKLTVEVFDRYENYPITLDFFLPDGRLYQSIEVGDDEVEVEIDGRLLAKGVYFLAVKYGGGLQKIYKLVKW